MRKKNRTNPKDRYVVVQISRDDAIKKLQEQEETRRKNPNTSYAFGLFDNYRNKSLVAVATFGSPPSPTICKGLCGEDERLNIIELNSLWADSSVSNDAVAYFLRTAVKRVPKEIVISYVPTNSNERIRKVFKNLGFLYTGLTKERTNRVDASGQVRHNRSKDYNKAETYIVPRPRKHRFVLFNTNDKAREKQLIGKLRYDVFAY